MTMIAQLKGIIETGTIDEMIDFLKGLQEQDKKTLAPELKNLNAYYSEMVDLTTMEVPTARWQVGRSYGYRARGDQGAMLSIASFVCLDKKGFEKTIYPVGVLTKEKLDLILPWYVPTWFRQLLEEINTGKNYRISYDVMMQLQAAGHFIPSAALIANHFPTYISTASQADMLTYPDTLDKHVWYLFEYPSNINYTGPNFKDFIQAFAAEGRLDRMRLLRESLLAANRNFNKVLVGWFMELFSSFKPTTAELKILEPVLMMVLDAKHSMAVSLALSQLKQLKELDDTSFIAHLPQVILSGTKGILTTVLQLSETICKQYENARQPLCVQLCHIFLNKDEGLQQKAAKLITTYGFPATEELQQQLQQYADTMLTGVRQLLLTDAVSIQLAEDEQAETLPLIGEHNLIPGINTVDELVYFASQALENNAPYHAELLPAVLINLQHLITDEVLVQLKPAMKRAEKLRDRPTNNMGLIDVYLTRFMLSYFKQEPKGPNLEITDNYVFPFFFLMQHTLEKLAAKDALPLLSTPTHTPGWIDPAVLVQRLAQYKEKAPCELDLQIAISRCALEDTTTAIALAKQLLTGEHLELLLFLFGAAVDSKKGNAWVQAALRKGIILPETNLPVEYMNGEFAWKTEVESYLAYGPYNRETRDYERVPATRTTIMIDLPEVGPLDAAAPLLQDYLVNRAKYFHYSAPDVPRILSLTPANPSLALANIIQRCMPLSGMYEVTETTTITAAITCLKEQTLPYTDMAQVFIATCMLHADKTIRAFAAECWIAGVTYNRLTSEAIGRIIGVHQSKEWAPLKRLTDLITDHLLQISKQHNEGLEVLMTSCLEQLPDAPVKHLKKLLEIFAEVLVVNGHTVTQPVLQERLKVWEAAPGYKKLVAKMM